MINCLNCNKLFKAKRNDAKFCSASCRVKYSRTVTDNNRTLNVTDNNVTDNVRDNNVRDNGTDNVRDNVTLKNKRCKVCKRKIKDIKGLTTDGSTPDNAIIDRISTCLHCIKTL